MRIRSMLTVALAAMAALAVPALASASNWTEGGKELAGLQWSKEGAPLNSENGSVSLSGPVRWLYANALGIECNINADVTLNAGGGSGQVTKVATSPAECKSSIALQNGCGKVTEVSAEALPWSASATESGGTKRISISGAVLHYKMEGGPFCTTYSLNEMTYIGSIVGTPDKSASISNLTLSGSGTIFNSKKEPFFEAGISGPTPLSVSPAGKYGIIKRTAEVAINGSLGWTSEFGGMNCSVNGTLALETGSEGKLTSLNWSGCTSSQPGCGPVTSVTTNSLPATIVNDGSTIKIPSISLTVKHTNCTNTFTGELVASPNNKSAISSTFLAGTLLQNGTIKRSWTGSVNWTPAGVYGF